MRISIYFSAFFALIFTVVLSAHAADLPNVLCSPYVSGRKINIDRKSAQNTNWYAVIKDSAPQIAMKDESVMGLRLRRIKPTSPLKLLKLKRGDILTSINELRLTETFQIPFIISRALGCNKLRLGYLRHGISRHVYVNATWYTKKLFSSPIGVSTLGIGDAALQIARAAGPGLSNPGLLSDSQLESVAITAAEIGSAKIQILNEDIAAALSKN